MNPLPSSSATRSISRAFLLDYGQGRMEPETILVRDALQRRGIPTTSFVRKQLDRRQLSLGADALVVGDVPTVESALRALGLSVPSCECYPETLTPFLRRSVWPSTLAAVEARMACEGTPIFVKPRDEIKRFTGFVCTSYGDLAQIHDVSRKALVWCAEPVGWRAEFRAFVLDGSLVGFRPYAGDAGVQVDMDLVREAVDTWTASGKASSAYAIDFGVLNDGRTALVELNDGYALGAYGLDGDVYTDVMIRRWVELTEPLVQARRGTAPSDHGE